MYNVCYKQPIYQMNHTCSCGIMVSLVSSKCTNNVTNPFITHGYHRNGMEQHHIPFLVPKCTMYVTNNLFPVPVQHKPQFVLFGKDPAQTCPGMPVAV